MTPQTVVVTGATGFIGRHVVAELAREGASVRAVVRRRDAAFPPEISQVVVPALDDPAALPVLRAAMDGATAVAHLAGRAHQIRDRAQDPLEAFRQGNVATTRALLDAMAGSGVRRMVLLSTVAAAVSATTDPVTDFVEPTPATPYGQSKLEMERLALAAGPGVGIQPIILRPPLVYGPGMKGNPLRLMGLVAARRPIPVSVPPTRRSSVYVGNLAQAIALALRHPAIGSQPYFVSDSATLTTVEFIDAMAEALSVRARILPVPRRLLEAAGKVGDVISKVVPFPFTSYEVGRLTASVEVESSHFWKSAGSAPEFSIAEGMAATATWFRSSGG